MRSPVSFLLCLSAALLAGCADPPPQPEKPDPQKTEVDPESNTFTITDSTEQAGPEDDALASLKAHLERVALDLMVKEVLGDDEEYRRNNEKVFDLFLEHAREFVEASELANKRRLSPASKRLYATFRIRISREKVTKKLQREGILVSQQGKMRVLLVVRSPAEGAQSSPLAQAYLDDLAESLSAELLKRGFQTKLWRDIRASLADSKRGAPASTARLLEGYVTGEDWKRPKDERYELPLLLLRSEGRLLVGFRIERLERRETGYELLARADAYDLLQGEALGYETESGRAEIGDRSLALARQALVTEVAQRLVRRFA
ncbi:hypothetical protein HY251_05255, partial [bacterium]|nr:hypothetical protein [bacterium]